MNYILGSGIIGCLAKQILPGDWTIIPFGRSRYYSYEIPLSDDFIIYDEKIDQFISKYATTKLMYKRPFSFKGQLIYNDPMIANLYIDKLYGNERNPLAVNLCKTTFMSYDLSIGKLYKTLQNQYTDLAANNAKFDHATLTIDTNNRVIKTKSGDFPYEKVISTIPLDKLCGRCNINLKLVSKPVIYYHIITKRVDLEGATQALVADKDFMFFKVQKVANDHYIFMTTEAIDKPLLYFGAFIGYDLDILEVTRIDDVIPIGIPPDLSIFESNGITCVGSNAQHDDFMDVGSCIKKLLTWSK